MWSAPLIHGLGSLLTQLKNAILSTKPLENGQSYTAENIVKLYERFSLNSLLKTK